MPMPMTLHRNLLALACTTLVYMGCGGDDGGGHHDSGTTGSPDQAGAVCEVPADCYPEVDHSEIQGGDVLCLDRVRAGYCTHECTGDADCCAVEGECKTDLPQVCAPFESSGMMMCFLSCEQSDVDAAGAENDQAFCQEHVSPDFICRSSGGGGQNRKVCVPGDCGVGAACGSDADCDPNLTCLGHVDGGYCGVDDCSSNADCPVDSLCVTDGKVNYCARTCAANPDCSFCRDPSVAAACVSDAEFVEAGTSGTVCVVPG